MCSVNDQKLFALDVGLGGADIHFQVIPLIFKSSRCQLWVGAIWNIHTSVNVV